MQNIQSLAFDDIKANFIAHLKDPANGTAFRDYNYDASGISTIINLLAYNTHFLGYYVKMLLSESFVDSAKLKESMTGHAKLVGYTHRGLASSRAELYVTTDWMTAAQEPETLSVTIHAGTTFSATTDTNERRTFTTIDDFVLYKRVSNGLLGADARVRYVNETDPLTPLPVYEGTRETWKFLVGSDVHPRFVIKDKGVDYTTIQVRVHDTESTTAFTPFTLAKTAMGVDSGSKVFYVTTNEEGYYEIFFGNNVFGKGVVAGNMIETTYVVTNGSTGNGAGRNSVWGDAVTPASVVDAAPIKIDTITIPAYDRPISSGGLDEETIDEMRFNIPNHYRRQNRIVTVDDYKTVILGEYRNIDSINVWGGETAYRKEFGKVFISIKPKFADVLSPTLKKDIANNLLKRYGVVGINPVFIDPEYIYLDMNVFATYDKLKTNSGKTQIATDVQSAITEYASSNLGVFGAWYSEVDAMSAAKKADSSIKTVYSFKTMRKTINVRYSNQPEIEVLFGNPIETGIISSKFMYNNIEVMLEDDITTGLIYVVNAATRVRAIAASVGNADYANGILTIKMPPRFNMVGNYDFITYGTLNVSVVPVNPDIRAFMNNIVRISTITVKADA